MSALVCGTFRTFLADFSDRSLERMELRAIDVCDVGVSIDMPSDCPTLQRAGF
jgi:hypothetical protein